ncbi:MAG: N-acetylmuramoyl-L-alanine amidase [Oscillospiraceae bacterium]|jgi:N-acetylmuramoyl-L-alanine amidase|nr:N-acetylmuramoyl-L-alanine amidase [Oscillospiraceae bacterium]
MNLIQDFWTQNVCVRRNAEQLDSRYTKFQAGPTGIMVHSTAAPGRMAKAFRDSWDIASGSDGKVFEKAVAAFLDNTEIRQCMPFNYRGYHAGGTANDSYIGFEICEPPGFKYGGGATMVGYDPEAQQPYFDAVYTQTAQLCAFLCKTFNIKPEYPNLICHSEGCTLGIASNHADVMHWWPKHGKSMDTLRADVAALLAGKEENEDMTDAQFAEFMGRYISGLRADKTAPSWLSPDVIQNAKNAGVITGDASGNLQLNGLVTRAEVIAMTSHYQLKG